MINLTNNINKQEELSGNWEYKKDGELRGFNQILLNKEQKKIKKSSYNLKLINEILWMVDLPDDLKYLIPTLYDYILEPPLVSVTMELINAKSLSEQYVCDELSIEEWISLLDEIKSMTAKFREYHSPISLDMISLRSELYLKKVLDRLTHYHWDNALKDLMDCNINGMYYPSVSTMLAELSNYFMKLCNIANKEMNRGSVVMHGDLCLSNMIWDKKNLKLVDPRGSYHSEPTIYGDEWYDIAKLSHSFNGNYDFIINNKFELLSGSTDGVVYKVFKSNKQLEVERIFNEKFLNDPIQNLIISFIESTLFISMIPLHEDNLERQKAMVVTARMTYFKFTEQLKRINK